MKDKNKPKEPVDSILNKKRSTGKHKELDNNHIPDVGKKVKELDKDI